ncbi:non-ribosomal peptide synthetase [Williamsia herbipolensis]|uniref:non-ribosomal peptide synthetase n=1 Tax=Williamsia herbipolensis TaxID=1603258 RepID=UPI0005F86FA7|nr:non-ribosomal peptide synthetase [Williamsia herbipolensis]
MPGAQRQPLTRAQQALWDLQGALPDGSVNVAYYLDLVGPLDAGLLDDVGRAFVARVPTLYLRFDTTGESVESVYDPTLTDAKVDLDLRAEPDPISAAQNWMATDAATPIDPARDRTALFAVLRIADDRHLIYMRGHHLVADGAAALRLLAEWGQCYTDAVEGRTPDYPPAEDFGPALRADADYLTSTRRERDRSYWLDTLAGAPPPPTLSRRAGAMSTRTHHLTEVVAPGTSELLRQVQAAHTTTMPAVVGTALAIYLARMTGHHDIQFALPVAARAVAALRHTRLPVSNVVPIRTHLTRTATARDTLHATQSAMLGALRHQRYRYEDIRRDLAAAGTPVPTTPGVTGPVLNLMLAEPTIRFGDAVGGVQIVSAGPVDDLAFTVYPRVAADGSVATQIDLDANPHRYTLAEARDHHARFLRLLDTVCRELLDAPDTLVGDIPLLTDTEHAALASVSGPTWAPEPAPAIDTSPPPGGVARLGETIAIEIPRGAGLSRAIRAGLSSPATMLILDPDLPATRRQQILDRVRPRTIVTADEMTPSVESGVGPSAAPLDAPAYIVFTSGTTGEPKGVVVPRRGIGALSADLRSRFRIDTAARVAQLAAASFDASIFEHILADAIGGTIVPAPPGTLVGAHLTRFLNDHSITHAVITPSVLATIDPDHLEHGVLATLMTAGEPLPGGLAARWATGRTLHNLYGPAETTIMATAACIEPSADTALAPPIGAPITGTRVHVLDARLRPVPPGAPGELYVSGPSLALGYLADTPSTAARFVADPTAPGERMYRTGDLVAWDHDLTGLTYLGRGDDQVQIRGVRVELAEIESVASLIDAVDGAVAVVDDGTLELAVVTSDPVTVRPALRRLFAERLPPAMWPSRISIVDHLPLTPTGKIDRDAVAALPRLDPDVPYVAPSTPAELVVASVVSDVLGVDAPSVAADIVDLGATSLNAVEVAAALVQRTGVSVTVRDVLTSVSLRELAARIDSALAASDVPERPDHPPASAQQTAMVVSARLDPTSTAEVLVGSVTLRGAAGNAGAVRAAIADVVERHEILRTVVRVGVSGELWQDVLPTDDVIAGILVEMVLPDPRAVTDPTTSVPAQISVREHADALVFAIAVHHALIDDASIDVLATDLATACAARLRGAAPDWTENPIQYADATAMIAAALGSPSDPGSTYAAQLQFWRDELRDLPPRPRLPSPSASRATGAREVSATVATTDLAGDTYAVAHTIVAAVIARFTGSLDLTLATVHSGRDLLPARPAAGMFVNPVAIRTRLDPGAPFSTVLEATETTVRNALLHSDLPVADVARICEPRRSPTIAPLSDVLISYRATDRAHGAAETFGLDIEVSEEPARHARVPLQWNLDRTTDGLRVALTHDAALIDDETAAAMVDAVVGAFGRAAANPESPLHELVPGSGAGFEVIPASVDERTVVDVVAATADAFRTAPALIDGDTRYSYDELMTQARAIGADLASRGVRAGDRVAIALPRGARAVIAQLGTQMAGAAYIPIDIALPAARVAAILDTAVPALVVVDGDTPDLGAHTTVSLDELEADGSAWTPVRVPAGAEAYVIFTSGSTGRPKGVSVSHGAVVAMLDGVAGSYTRDDVFSCVHSLAFDFSVFEILAPWRVGASVVLADVDTVRDPTALWRFVQDRRISVLSQTPAAFAALAAEAIRVGEGTTALGRVVFGGSALYFDRFWRFAATVGNTTAFTNMWGITEGAVHVTSTPVAVTSERRSLIGDPLPGMAISVLDTTLAPVPTGVWGELYIAGAHLADGYLGPAAQTAERFVAAPGGVRMYRTGDMVRRTHDGELEYLGRSDDQVQLRGFRVETGEVAAALRAVPGVTDAVVSVADRDRVDGGTLVAHVIAAGDDITPASLRAAVSETLPAHAVPTRVVLVDAWPLTPSGKIDIAALPQPTSGQAVDTGRDVDGYLPAVRAVVAGVLGLAESDLDTGLSLLDLGAHSLSYMHIAVGLAAATGRQPAVRDIVAAPTVAALSRVVARSPVALSPVAAIDGGGDDPVEYIPTAQQRGLWFLHRVSPASTVYHLPLRIDLNAAVGVDVLRFAAIDVIARHEILRTVLVDSDGTPRARVLSVADVTAFVDRAISGSQQVSDVDAAATLAARSPFDLGTAPGWRMHLFDARGQEGSGRRDADEPDRVLVIVAHHAVADGWSVQILGRDVLTAITARMQGVAPVWPAPAEPYSVFARRRAARGAVADAVIDHWRGVLDGAPTQMSLPEPAVGVDGSGPEPAAHLETTLSPTVRDRVVALADACGATPFHVVHVAVNRVIASIAGTDDVVIAVPTAGRDTAADLAGVGMYVRMVVLRSPVGTDVSVPDAVSASARALTGATGDLAIEYEDLVAAVAPTNGGDRQPFLDVIAAYAEDTLDAESLPTGDSEIVHALTPIRVPHARVPLEFTVTDRRDGGLELVLTVGTRTVDTTAAEQILDRVASMLETLAEGGPDRMVREALPPADRAALVGPPRAPLRDPGRAFTEHARRSPDSVAVIDAGRSVTYGELFAAVDQLTRSLSDGGVGAGTRVVVTAGRSAALLAVTVALHDLGATYVPIDPSYPAERAAAILDAVWPAVPITIEPATDYDGDTILGSRVLTYTAIGAGPAVVRSLPGDLPAYIVHTSGSTGTPKGVVVTRDNLASMLSATLPRIAPRPADVWTWSHSPAFDFSVWETWGPLTTGGAIVIVDTDTSRDPTVLARLLDDTGVTILSQTPTAFARIADSAALHPALRWVVFGGEAVAPATLAAWAARHPATQLVNLYGITETTVHLTQQILDVADQRSVIGQPLPGMSLRVLDSRLRPVPVGARGEVYVLGPQLAAGYLDQPGRTAERFVAAPDGARMYRTGDHVRRIDADRLVYLGRTDDQVQIRGFRVELGEVVSALRALPGVRDARVVVRPGPLAGDETLLGFVIGDDVDTDALRTRCAAVLPAQSVPSSILAVPGWPLTPTRKVDTAALLATADTASTVSRPLTPQEQVVAAVVAEVTGTDNARIGAGANFFALGGSSLSATRLAAALSDVAGAAITVRSVFDHPTVAMLAAVVDAAHDVGVTVPGPVAMPRPDRLPLTPQQEEIWLEWTLHPEDTGYHLVTAVPVDEGVATMLRDPDSRERIARQARALIERHDALRTCYPVDDLGPRQELVDLDSITIDLTPVVVDDAAAIVADLLAPFDLAAQPPWRVRVADTPYGMVIGAAGHHIAADGRSIAVLEREIATFIDGATPPMAPSLDFASYTQWYRSMLTARDADLQSFWRGVFAEPVQPIRLPGVAATVGERAPEPAVVAVALLPAETVTRLAAWVIERHTTVFITVHAALASVLARRGATRDIIVGTATSGRNAAALADTVGMFARTVPLRNDIDVDAPFTDVLAAVTATDLDAFAHADLPAAAITAIADPDRTTAGRALTTVVLSDLLTDRPGSAALSTDVDALAASGLLRTVFGLDFSVSRHGDDLRIALVYRPSTVDAAVAQGMVDDVATVIDAVLSRPDVAVGDVLVDTSARSTETVARSAGEGRGEPRVADGTVGGILAVAARRHADRIALIDGDERITYAEADAHARAIAGALRAAGVGRGDIVVSHAPRSRWSVLATWGISYAGAAFLAVNPTDPPTRRARVLADAAPAAILTAPGHPVTDIPLDAPVLALTDAMTHDPIVAPVAVGLDDLAYVVFTSGSTGTPKGVAVSHRGVGPMLATLLNGLSVDESSVMLHNYAPSFDAHILEVMMAVAAGAQMVICPPEVIGGDELRDIITRHGVNTVYSTPAVLGTMDPAALPHVTRMTVGGEAIPPAIAAAWSPRRQLANLYGPTETTIVVTASLRMDTGPVHIGTAVAGSSVAVLDARLRPVPDDTVGELYIRGESLARGYLGRPDLTAERFVADPNTPGGRMYRSGDLAHRRSDGTVVTHGRTDSQLAVRGLRVEPAEVDAALVAIPGVRDAVCDLYATPSGVDVLAAWVVLETADDPMDADDLRRATREVLPRGMVPALITVVDELPRTANGKLDRRALPVPATPSGRPAQTPTELAIVAVWAQVIGVDAETIDTASDFFSLGGTSFSATRVVGRLRESTGRDVAVRQLFDARTVADLAADLDAMPATDVRGVRPVHLPTPASVPLAYPQRRMWFLNRLDPESTAYTVPVIAWISGPVDVERIRRAVRRVAQRHESLRTVYPDTPDGPRQVVLPSSDVAVPALIRVDTGDAEHAVRDFVTTRIDLTAATAFRAAVFEVVTPDGPRWLLAVAMHHVAVDGWSLRTLLADLATAYTSDTDLPVPELTYIDVTRWQLGRLGDAGDPQSEYARQMAFWGEELAGLGEPPRLPGHGSGSIGGRVTAVLPADLAASVTAIAHDAGATVFHAVHAVVATVLARWTGRTDVVVGAPVLGRPDPAFEPIVGMFVNTVVLRTALDPAATVHDSLRTVRDTDLAAMAHDGVPYDAVARAVRPDHRGRHDPLVSVLVVTQEARAVLDPALGDPDDPSGGISLGDSRIEPIGDIDHLVSAKFDLEVVIAPAPGGALELIVLHAPAIPGATAQAMADQLLILLTAATGAPHEPFPLIDDGLRAETPAPETTAETTETAANAVADLDVDVDAVRTVFAEVLDIAVDHIGADDDFFGLGGTSLATTQVVAALARRTGRRVPVAEVFAHPTAAGLATSLGAVTASTADPMTDALARVMAEGPAGTRSARIPLTTAQRRIWFADRLSRDRSATAMYAVPVVVPLEGDVSETAVAAAVRAVVDRHAPLRTVYPADAGQPYQHVLPSCRPSVLAVDLGDRSWADALADPPAALRGHLAAPVDITTEPPVRAVSVRGRDGRFLLLLVHHISLDGQSVPLIAADLTAALAGDWLAPLDVTYPQWALAENAVPAAQWATERARVVAAVEGYSGILDIPTDRARTATRSLATGAVPVAPPPVVVAAIGARARAAAVTPFHVWHAALVLVLAGAADTDDVAVGTPVSVRSLPEIDSVAGMFVSTAVLRTHLGARGDDPMTIDALLATVRDVDIAAIGARLVGLDDVIAAIRPAREAGRHPLVQVLLSWAADTLPPAPWTGAESAEHQLSAPSEFDLQFTVSPDGAATVTYSTDLFDAHTPRGLGERWIRAVTALVTLDGDTPLGALDLRDPAEAARDAVERSVLASRSMMTLGEVFSRAAGVFADDVAIDDGTQVLTYAELDRRSAQVATRLVDTGVRPGDRVAMMLPRSVESVIATWAIVRVGAVLVPVDPGYPADRVARMLAMTGVPVAIGAESAPGVTVIGVGDPSAEDSPDIGWATMLIDAPAYIIFTSGSTGTPNAVTVTHRGVSLFADAVASRLMAADRVAHHSSPSFDASIMELVRAAGAGARLAVIAPDRVGGGEGTAELARLGVTTLFTSPTVLATLDPSALPALRLVEVGGEAVAPEVLQPWATGRDVATVYGPTEATIMVCWAWFDAGTAVGPMLGRQADSVGVAVLDRRMRPVPDGCVGELYLFGPVLAQGYGEAALTASRFVAADDGERMYRTGDLVRRTPSGLTFVGRGDRQVQIRGVRVEPGEVDAAARAVGAVHAATAVVAGPAGDTLITYAVSDRPGADIRAAMADRLPAHLVPAQVILVDELPVTPVGKLDIAALPTPTWDGAGDAALTRIEETVLGAFRAATGQTSIGIHDDFFAVGGTSLQLIPLVTALREEAGVDIGLAVVLTHPTAGSLAAVIDAGDTAGTTIPEEIAALLTHVIDLTPVDRAENAVDRADNAVDRAGNAVERAETPLWMVHPASGVASMYRPLAEALTGTAPVFGLQLPDLLDTTPTSPGTVSALAAAHLDAVRSRQPHGPYRFGGWSVGGQIAHEMAHLATAAGESVDIVVLLDARVGVDVAEAGAEALTIDPDTAEALRAADARRFAEYTRRVEEIAASAAAFAPQPAPIADLVMVAASNTTDAAIDRWRTGPGRVTVERVDAVHADMGKPATMRAIGGMLSMAMSEIAAAADRPGGPTDEPTANRGHR